MLRKFKAVFLILSIGCGTVSAADVGELTHNPYHMANWTEAEREVWQVIETWNRAFAENDAEAYFHYISDDITVLTPSNPYRVEGKPDDREEFEFGTASWRRLLSSAPSSLSTSKLSPRSTCCDRTPVSNPSSAA